MSVKTTLSSFLIQARTRRRLTQQELANISQLVVNTISNVERGAHKNLSVRSATAIGMALHEVQPFSESELADFCRLTDVPAHIFSQTPQLSSRDKDRRQIQPYIDSLLSRYTPESVMFFLQSIETMTRALIPRGHREQPQELTHVSAPRYRADLNATEQIHTTYAAAPSPKAEKKPKNRRA